MFPHSPLGPASSCLKSKSTPRLDSSPAHYTALCQIQSPEVGVMGTSIHQRVLEPSSHLPGGTTSQPLKNGATPTLKSPPQPSLGGQPPALPREPTLLMVLSRSPRTLSTLLAITALRAEPQHCPSHSAS